MVNINISIRKEAYEFLSSMKGENKSFSDVILEFRKEKSVMDFFGCLKDANIDWKEREKEMKNVRESFNRRLK